jgi:hypothetical protein
MNNTELTLDQLSEVAGGQSLAQSSQGGIYQAKMLAETAMKTAAAASAVTGAMQTAATSALIQTGVATGSMQASTAATGVLAARVEASAPTGAI